MSATATNSELATILSPTQLFTFTDCQARYWFRYGLRLPDPKNANLALGIAVHAAIAWYLRHRIAGGTIEPADAVERFSCELGQQLEDAELRETDDVPEIHATGRILVSRYAAEVAPTIQPAAIEELVEGVIAGVRVQGRVDIREVDGTLRDIKTACRRPSGVSAKHAFQLATYVQITPAASTSAVIDTLVKTKTPQIVQLPYEVGAAEILATRRMYPLVQEAMRAGLYVPNRDSNLCSRSNCPFWRSCEREFGGRVSQ
jgi:hypothetical protein